MSPHIFPSRPSSSQMIGRLREEKPALERAAKRLLGEVELERRRAGAALAAAQPLRAFNHSLVPTQPAPTSLPQPVQQQPQLHPGSVGPVPARLSQPRGLLGPRPTVPPAAVAHAPAAGTRIHSSFQPHAFTLAEHVAAWPVQAVAAHPRTALAGPTVAPKVQPPSPGWPACTTDHARAPSEDASSPKGRGLHVLAADVREAASGGGLSGRVSKSLESLLFIRSGASVNAALATRNRKTGRHGQAGWQAELAQLGAGE